MKPWLVHRTRLTAAEKDRVFMGTSVYTVLSLRVFPKIKTSPKYDVLVAWARLPPGGVRV